MFFETSAGLKPPPFKHTVYNALVVPRPIGWISTLSTDGIVNLAPYSFFNSVSGDPPCVMYCPNGWRSGTKEPKDSLTNAEETGEFVFNMCTYELRDQMNATAAHVPASVDEMAEANLEAAPCHLETAARAGITDRAGVHLSADGEAAVIEQWRTQQHRHRPGGGYSRGR